jgi:hypothetical protein
VSAGNGQVILLKIGQNSCIQWRGDHVTSETGVNFFYFPLISSRNRSCVLETTDEMISIHIAQIGNAILLSSFKLDTIARCRVCLRRRSDVYAG